MDTVCAAAPQLPPRSGRAPIPPPDDSFSDSGDDWGSEFEDEAGDDYIEPTSRPNLVQGPDVILRRDRPVPAPRVCQDEPQEVYEVVEESAPVTSVPGGGLHRRETILDKLKSALNQRQNEIADEAPPPPRPPRRGPPPEPVSQQRDEPDRAPVFPPLPGVHRPPPPLPQDQPKPPEDVYEIMEDKDGSHTETANGDDDDDYLKPDPVKTPKGGDGYIQFGNTRVDPVAEKSQKPTKHARHPPPVAQNDPSPPPPRPGGQRNVGTSNPPQAVNNPQATEAMVEGDLNRYPWYHGNIGRTDATNILELYCTDGMFLIRASERSPDQPYTLALWYGDRSWNLPIRLRGDKRYAAGTEKHGETSFGTIVELVEYYKKTMLALKGRAGPRLQQPAPRR